MSDKITSSSSRKLISSAQAGDDAAINRFCIKYWPVVEGWAQKFSIGGAAPEDVAQNVLMRVIPSLHQYNSEKGRFRSWLAKITQNCAIDMINDRGMNVDGFFGDINQLWELLENKNTFAVENLDYELEELRENSFVVADSIREGFDDDTWYCFTAMTELGLTAKEIGTQIGVSPEAVRQRKARVIKKLRGLFDD